MASVPPAVSEAHKGTEKLLDGIGDLLTTLLEGPAAGDEAGSLDALDAQLSSFFHSFAALRSRHQATHLTVAILALTKSGKGIHIVPEQPATQQYNGRGDAYLVACNSRLLSVSGAGCSFAPSPVWCQGLPQKANILGFSLKFHEML